MDFVKEILMWFGASVLVFYVTLAIFFLVKWMVDKFTSRVIRGVCDNLKVTGVQGAPGPKGDKGDKGDSGLPDVDEYCNHYIMMVVNGTWQLVDLEKFVKSYIDIAKEED